MSENDVAGCRSADTTGMAAAVLAEIADALSRMAATAEETSIDLRGLPMTDADRNELQEALGRGEVTATLDVAGRSEILETGFSGVWWVRHFGNDARVSSEEIVIGRIPAILLAHPDDVAAAASRLHIVLSTATDARINSGAAIHSLGETIHAG
ncbi:MAG: hydrogenase expression/formation C-terminal domain-containing protein [Hyphomicrobiaceae bacterium]